MTQIDGRDHARCVATENACGVDVYTVSTEVGGTYMKSRHYNGCFNSDELISNLQQQFSANGDDLKFRQVILDYFWTIFIFECHAQCQSAL